jgi:hypothetical protein
MDIEVAKSIRIDAGELANSMSIEECMEVFCEAANRLGDNDDWTGRRIWAEKVNGVLSENAMFMLSEIFAERHRKNLEWKQTTEKGQE